MAWIVPVAFFTIILLIALVGVAKSLFIWLDSRKAKLEEEVGEVFDTYHVLQAPVTSPSGEISATSIPATAYNPQLDSYGCMVRLADGYVGDVSMIMEAWSRNKIGAKLKVTFRRCRHVRRIHVVSYSE